jgi:hypothetical protein
MLSVTILFFHNLKFTKRKNGLSACNLVVADAAMTIGGFAAVWANAFAIVDGVAAGFASRLIWFFLQQFSPLLTILRAFACELRFRKMR